ncbi:MAG: TolC family protein [bacterium]
MRFKIYPFLILLLFGIVFSFSGCAFYGAPEKVKVTIPSAFKEALKPSGYHVKNYWWKNFDDPVLDGIVARALKKNITYKIAVKNIQIARTYVAENESGLFPQVNLASFASRNQPSIFQGPFQIPQQHIYNMYQIGANASYEADVWHAVANEVNQAKAGVEISREDAAIVRLTLLSNVAAAYFQLCAINSNISNLREQLETAKKILSLNDALYKSGIINIEPVDNAETQTENIKSGLDNLLRQKIITLNTLAYYLGEYPENFKIKLTLKDFGSTEYFKLIPPNLPSSVLTQRPDVKSSEYTVLSYAYAKKVSLANFFPMFFLTGSFGYASTSLSDFISNATNVWSYGLDILEPIFNYKKTISQYKRSKLQYEQAVLNYRNTVINAFKEVDSALGSYDKDRKTLSAYERNYRSAENLDKIYKIQYRTGMASYLVYLGYKLNLLNAGYNLTNQNLLLREDVIQIYNVLGMGLKEEKASPY